ncbi:SDR family NAD(P)-dependent oxidoreductase [Nocardia sp. 2YAB30]|uniref:SDR family NAD(P)-dependent oxidoreductase n=1 Tax=unclassified Nocardia TaxID=2637762 RepID=UPI003F981FA8
MELGLTGRTAVVTGAGRGIGLAITRTLVAEGMRVVGAARTITDELRATGATVVSVDLATSGGAHELIEQALAGSGGIDVLINNVGGADFNALAGFLDIDDDTWRRTFDLNFFSTVRVTRAALPSLLQRRGAVVNVSSIAGRAPGGAVADYGVAKAAVTALSKSLAEQFGPLGVRVNTVSPGPVRTAFWEAADGPGGKIAAANGTRVEEFLPQLPAAVGMTTGRLIEAGEVAAQVAFLASDHARSIVGADLVIDGGALKNI